ncbi:hypothetical protein GGX14DRAFT_384853 [Mycena pura]|uniref:Deoxyribonuclease NucA/NucB domain-containing protein n=1 Tax=Mycena pura TaxID=153505 RepID=A0AAD6YSP0_9AGAR|nr:hypothetical protein GGX14DRAFT_384853 [Mycena pura]
MAAILIFLSFNVVCSALGNILLRDTSHLAPRLGNSTYAFTKLDPVSRLGKRQEEEECTIPGGVACVNDPEHCCPPGDTCQLAISNCCPSYGLNSFCCPSVSTGCCITGSSCCGTNCCPPGYSCSGGECLIRTTATPTKTTGTTTTKSTQAACTLGLGRRAEGTDCASATVPTETRVPTVKPLVFDYKRLSEKRKPKYSAQQMQDRQNALTELFTNMCLGLENRGQLQSEIYTFVEDEAEKYQNRKAVGCTGSPCAHLPGQSCDEFPFASTTAGGASAIWNCIPEMAQDIQGGVISSWKSRNKVTADTDFELQIVNWDCKNPPTPPLALVAQQQQFGSSIGTEAGTLHLVTRAETNSNATILSMGKYLPVAYLDPYQDVFPPFDDSDPNNHTIVSLGDMAAGSYNISVQVTGTVSSAYIIDSEGAQFAQVTVQNGAAGPMGLSFSLPYDNVGISLIMDTQADTINYNASVVEVASNSTSTGTPSSSASGNRSRGVDIAVLPVLAVFAYLLRLW